MTSKEWWEKQPLSRKKIHYLRRNLMNRYGGDVTREELLAELGEPTECYICGDLLDWECCEVDHLLSPKRGGDPLRGNLKWICRECNAIKSDLTPEELFAWCRKVLAHQETK